MLICFGLGAVFKGLKPCSQAEANQHEPLELDQADLLLISDEVTYASLDAFMSSIRRSASRRQAGGSQPHQLEPKWLRILAIECLACRFPVTDRVLSSA